MIEPEKTLKSKINTIYVGNNVIECKHYTS